MGRIEIVATGPELIHGGVRSLEAVLEEIISGAEKEIIMITYMITEASLPMLRLIKEAMMRNVRVTFVLNSFSSLDTRIMKNYLHQLQKENPDQFRLINFRDKTGRDIHAKVTIIDRKKALIGSANLTRGGMVENYEIGVFIEDEAVWLLAKVIDYLLIYTEEES